MKGSGHTIKNIKIQSGSSLLVTRHEAFQKYWINLQKGIEGMSNGNFYSWTTQSMQMYLSSKCNLTSVSLTQCTPQIALQNKC